MTEVMGDLMMCVMNRGQCVYHLGNKKRGSVFLAYLPFASLKFKKLWEVREENQII